jgi:outer membrane lipopolysaccharide assembly protein LptE/RlpB
VSGPVVFSGVGGTRVTFPSGVVVFVASERSRAATLKILNASWEDARFSVDRETYDAEVMAPLRAELRAAIDERVAEILAAGDPL